MQYAIGIDFGTTNSAVAMADANGHVTTGHFSWGNENLETFRSILFFEAPEKGVRRHFAAYSGPEAIYHYLHADNGGRLIQSIKSYLSNAELRATNLFGRNYRFEELIGYLVRSLKAATINSGIPLESKAVVGRPVRFVGSKNKSDDAFAVSRLREALAMAEITDVHFELEPVAAAYSYETRLDHDELLLVADFGGGTTDFSLIQVGPNVRKTKSAEERIIGNGGLGLAGDAFDAKLVRHVVAPLLGKDSACRLIDKTTTMPNWPYAKLEHWHHLSFLKSKENMEALKSLHAQALEPDKIELLILLVSEDLGFQLHNAIQRTKLELSKQLETTFDLQVPGIHISKKVTRREFEEWIAEERHAITHCVENLLKNTGVKASQIDRVFLTGGTSFVPSVRNIFEKRFGAEKMSGGSEFTSVAQGLALRALDIHQRHKKH